MPIDPAHMDKLRRLCMHELAHYIVGRTLARMGDGCRIDRTETGANPAKYGINPIFKHGL